MHRPRVMCPHCHACLGAQNRTTGGLKRSLLAHLRDCHGPLRRADVRAFHALSARAFAVFLVPPRDPP